LSLGLLTPCKGAHAAAPAPNSGRGQNSLSLKQVARGFSLRLVLSLRGGVKGLSLSKIPPSPPVFSSSAPLKETLRLGFRRLKKGEYGLGHFHATTIFAVHHNGSAAMAGDGQVTFGNQMIMKQGAKKVRRLHKGQVLAGFAGSVADALTLFEKFEGKLEEFQGNLRRAAVELAKEWRSDKVLRRLEAMMIVMDKEALLLVSGTGEVIEPDDGILAIGSGGAYALSAGRALKRHASHLSAKEIAEAALTIAGEICVFTNQRIIVEEV